MTDTMNYTRYEDVVAMPLADGTAGLFSDHGLIEQITPPPRAAGLVSLVGDYCCATVEVKAPLLVFLLTTLPPFEISLPLLAICKPVALPVTVGLRTRTNELTPFDPIPNVLLLAEVDPSTVTMVVPPPLSIG